MRSPGGSSGPPSIVVEDPTHRRTIVEHHRAGGISHRQEPTAPPRSPCRWLPERQGVLAPLVSALCRRSTACSIVRRPRTFCRI